MAPCFGSFAFVFLALVMSPAAIAQTQWSLATPYLPFSGQSVATYDPVAKRAIVVNLSSNTTWALSSVTGVWTQLTQPPGGPGWILDSALAYDSARQRAVLFGGADASGNPLGLTWELGSSAWQQVSTTVAPPGRRDAGMCFDVAAGVVRMVGGDAAPIGAAPIPLADVWTFDGVSWTQAPAGSAGPAGPTAMVYDIGRDLCVALAANGTFELQGSGFVPVATGNAPPPRRSTALVFDALRERAVLFGGQVGGASTRGDVWEYDGSTWLQRLPFGLVPRRERHAMVYDPELSATRIFAGLETRITAGGLITTNFIYSDELHYGPVSPPIAEVFAQACYFYTVLSVEGMPWIGGAVTLTMPVAGTGLPPLMVFGASNEQWGTVPLPLPIGAFGFPNCELVVSPDALLMPTVISGSAMLTVPIPNQAGLLGARLFVQGFEPDPTGAGTGTYGLLLQVGGR